MTFRNGFSLHFVTFSRYICHIHTFCDYSVIHNMLKILYFVTCIFHYVENSAFRHVHISFIQYVENVVFRHVHISYLQHVENIAFRHVHISFIQHVENIVFRHVHISPNTSFSTIKTAIFIFRFWSVDTDMMEIKIRK